MGSFLEGKNRASEVFTIASALGVPVSADIQNAIKQVYGFAAEQLAKYVQIGGGLITGGNVAIAAAATILKALGVGGNQPTDFDKLYQRIHQDLQEIENKIEADSVHDQLAALDLIQADAETVQKAIANYLAFVQQGEGFDNPEKSSFDGLGSVSEGLYSHIDKESVWTHLSDADAVCQVKGISAKRFTPEADENPSFVWDYRPAIPVLLNCISARIGYLKAARADIHAANYPADLDEMADYVTEKHNQIQQGIVVVPAPGPAPGSPFEEIAPNTESFADFWEQWESPCGAVDKHAGVGVLEKFPMTQPSWHTYYETKQEYDAAVQLKVTIFAPVGFEKAVADGKALQAIDLDYWRKFNLLFLIRALRLRKQADDQAGLPELREVVRHLRALSGGAQAKEAPPTDRNLSLRDIVKPPAALIAELSPEPTQYAARLQNELVPVKSFRVFWPPATRALVAEFTADFMPPGSPQSVREMVVGGEALGTKQIA